MKKLICLLGVMSLAGIVSAQDVIVKIDGSTILSKVSEVNSDNIKYKKYSNPNGPTYTIAISEVLSVNYENGDKDTFNSNTSAVSADVANEEMIGTESAESRLANEALITSYNQKNFEWVPNDKRDDASFAWCRLLISPTSVMENDDVSIQLETGILRTSTGAFANSEPELEVTASRVPAWSNSAIQVKVRNKTNRTIFIDLGNTFITRGEEAQAYYAPTATSVISSSTNGASVNMGALAGAMGIGGSLGKLANGVTVGGANTSGTTTTEFAQRVISIPPMSTKTLSPMLLYTLGSRFPLFNAQPWYDDVRLFAGIKGLMAGDVIHWNEDNSPAKFSFFISYSNSEGLESLSTIATHLFVSEMLGIGKKAFNPVLKYYKHLGIPLHMRIWNDDDKGPRTDVNSFNIERMVQKK